MKKIKNSWKVKSSIDVDFLVLISENLLDQNNKSLIKFGNSNRRIVFVDSKVFDVKIDMIDNYFLKNNIDAKIISIDVCEDKKDINTLMEILNHIEEFKLSRRSEPIIAIGGGVLLDVVGLAANLYRRGVPYIKVPTTLLAIVDASVGVKTAINHFGRRNRLGSYYPPIAAFLDRSFLDTLNSKEIVYAMGEIIKMAVIKNSYLFEKLESNIPKIINDKFLKCNSSLEIISIATNDMIEELEPNLWEKNLERIVDFGHSFSPLLEMNSLSDNCVRPLSHGEAVAIDIVFSCCISFHRKLISHSELIRVINICKLSGLNIYHEYFCNKELLWKSLLDTTKHRNGNQNLPIPIEIGKTIFLNDITLSDIDASIKIYKKEVS